jgi:hypothetical protein
VTGTDSTMGVADTTRALAIGWAQAPGAARARRPAASAVIEMRFMVWSFHAQARAGPLAPSFNEATHPRADGLYRGDTHPAWRMAG